MIFSSGRPPGLLRVYYFGLLLYTANIPEVNKTTPKNEYMITAKRSLVSIHGLYIDNIRSVSVTSASTMHMWGMSFFIIFGLLPSRLIGYIEYVVILSLALARVV